MASREARDRVGHRVKVQASPRVVVVPPRARRQRDLFVRSPVDAISRIVAVIAPRAGDGSRDRVADEGRGQNGEKGGDRELAVDRAQKA